jgi:hypothetical protein
MTMETTPRLTPYELAFGSADFENETYPGIREEADVRGSDTAVPERFFMLAAVGEWLRAMRPDTEPDGAESTLPSADVVKEYGALLFHAYRFLDRGRHFHTIGVPLLRQLLSEERVGDWTFRAPSDAGYVQFPRQLLWARIDDEAPAETVDGFFWSIVDPDVGRPGRIDILLVLGMHPDRPGFSVIDASAPLPAPAPGHWADSTARPDGNDFSNILPGGELRDLLAIVSTAEVLKLVSRLFHYIDRTPGSIRPVPPGQRVEESGSGTLPASSLTASEITIVNQVDASQEEE